MRRILTVVVAATAVMLSVLPAASAAPKAPTFTATLATDSTCSLTATTTWSGANVATVYLNWYTDGATWGTSDAPGTGPNAGTFNRRSATATFQAGPFGLTTADPHSSHVLAHFYSKSGVQLGQVYSDPVGTTTCALPHPSA